jgi:hypothetical protein
MDNGLIFPYRFCRAHAEPGDAKPSKAEDVFGLILLETVTRTSSRQAMG